MNERVDPVRISIVGTGKRFFLYYVDILNELSRRNLVKVVSVHNRSEKRGKEAAKHFGCKYTTVIDKFPDNSEMIVNTLKGEIKDQIAKNVLEERKHLFLETPAGHNSKSVARLKSLSKKYNKLVEVAEDFAFFPEALLHQKIIRSGILGRVISVHNDFRAYAYHPIARMHMIVGSLPTNSKIRVAKTKLANGLYINEKHIFYETGVHYFEKIPNPKNHFLRKAGNFFVLCEKGILTDNFLLLQNRETIENISISKTLGDTNNPETIENLSIQVGNSTFNWASDWPKEWTRKHISLADSLVNLINAIKESGVPRYGLERAYRDIEIWEKSNLIHKYPILNYPVAMTAFNLALNAKRFYLDHETRH